MKVNVQQKPETQYKPFELTITIESANEAADLYAIFNHTQIMSTCVSLNSFELREAIERGHGGIPRYMPIHTKLSALL